MPDRLFDLGPTQGLPAKGCCMHCGKRLLSPFYVSFRNPKGGWYCSRGCLERRARA